MFKRPITYTNLDGQNVTQNFYFNLTVPELAHLELDMPGGLSNYWIKLLEDKNAGKMLHSFKELIATAYGEREGDFFMKETESGYSLGRRFLQHPAYHVLFLELLGPESSDDDFTNFLKAVVPPELVAQMDEAQAAGLVTVAGVPAAPSDATVQPIPGREAQGIQDDGDLVEKQMDSYSKEKLLAMTDEQFDRAVGTDQKKWDKDVLLVAFERRSRNQG